MHSALRLFDVTPLNLNLIGSTLGWMMALTTPCAGSTAGPPYMLVLQRHGSFHFESGWHWDGEEDREIRDNDGHTLNFSPMFLDVQKWMFLLLWSQMTLENDQIIPMASSCSACALESWVTLRL